jgi:hypothetical protein
LASPSSCCLTFLLHVRALLNLFRALYHHHHHHHHHVANMVQLNTIRQFWHKTPGPSSGVTNEGVDSNCKLDVFASLITKTIYNKPSTVITA